MYKLKRLAILLIILLSFSCSSFTKTDTIVYLIPKDFTGSVIILYSKTDRIFPRKVMTELLFIAFLTMVF